jgi:hypothetical protein
MVLKHNRTPEASWWHKENCNNIKKFCADNKKVLPHFE